MKKIILGLDLGKTFGISFWNDRKNDLSKEITMKKNHKPHELLEEITGFYNFCKAGRWEFEIVMETGQGFMSKNAWRGFGVQEWVVEHFCKEHNIPLHSYHISWLRNYERRLPKSNINDAIELVEHHFKKIGEQDE